MYTFQRRIIVYTAPCNTFQSKPYELYPKAVIYLTSDNNNPKSMEYKKGVLHKIQKQLLSIFTVSAMDNFLQIYYTLDGE